MTCEFCRYNMIEPERIVYEDEGFMAFTDGTDGKCTLIPKEHAGTEETVEDPPRFRSFIQYLLRAIKAAVGADEIEVQTHPGDHLSVTLTPSGGSAPKDFQEKIMWHLRDSDWYNTLNS